MQTNREENEMMIGPIWNSTMETATVSRTNAMVSDRRLELE